MRNRMFSAAIATALGLVTTHVRADCEDWRALSRYHYNKAVEGARWKRILLHLRKAAQAGMRRISLPATFGIDSLHEDCIRSVLPPDIRILPTLTVPVPPSRAAVIIGIM